MPRITRPAQRYRPSCRPARPNRAAPLLETLKLEQWIDISSRDGRPNDSPHPRLVDGEFVHQAAGDA